MKSVYYPEVEHLLKNALNAEKVLIFDHVVRCASKVKEGDRSVQGTSRMAHNDYTIRSGPQRVRDLLEAEEAEERLQHRFMQIIAVCRCMHPM